MVIGEQMNATEVRKKLNDIRFIYEMLAIPKDKMTELSKMTLKSLDEKYENESLTLWLCDQLTQSLDEIEKAKVVISTAQGILTGLNVGNIMSESLLHKDLRKVMIKYRGDYES
jgi:formate dehydrogenase maturation protein FdhE